MLAAATDGSGSPSTSIAAPTALPGPASAAAGLRGGVDGVLGRTSGWGGEPEARPTAASTTSRFLNASMGSIRMIKPDTRGLGSCL